MNFKDYFLNEALKEAIISYNLNEIPVGCIILKQNSIISKAHNLKETTKSSINHSEIIAIKKACNYLKSWTLNDCSMYVTLEPCLMCAGAIIESRIKNLYIGTNNPYNGFFSSNYHKYHKNLNIFWLNDKKCEFLINRFLKHVRKGLKSKP